MKTMLKNVVMILIFVITAFNQVLGQVDTLVKYNSGDNNMYINGVTIFNQPDSITLQHIVIRHNGSLEFMYVDSLNIDYNKVSINIVSNMPDSIWLEMNNLGIIISNGSTIYDLRITSLIITYQQDLSVNKIEFNPNSKLIGIYDLMGKKVNENVLKSNCIYIYKYDNGFCEKKLILK